MSPRTGVPQVNAVKAVAVEDLDSLPFPDWEQQKPASFPHAPHGAFARHFPIGVIFSTRGCPYGCKFCASPRFYDRRIRFRSPENVIAEIKWIIEKYGVREIQFADDNLTLRRDHIVRICNLIIENKIQCAFSCPNGIRADRIDDGMLALMKRAGFYCVALGIESANKNILENIEKKEPVETIQRAINLLRKHKILVNDLFIIGLPGETKATIEESINFACNSGLDRAHFSILTMLPGSALWDELQGEFTTRFEVTTFTNPDWVPAGLTKKDLVRAAGRAFRRFYFRPSYFLKNLLALHPSQIRHFLKRIADYKILKQ